LSALRSILNVEMATLEQVKTLEGLLAGASEVLTKNLINRPEWGIITFERAQNDLKKTAGLIETLRVMPLDYLPEQVAPAFVSQLNSLTPILVAIDNFSLSVGNPGGNRDSLTNQLHAQVDAIFTGVGSWLPFLAYQRGDVAANIDRLTRAAQEGREIIERARVEVQVKANELDAIISAAREASAAAGAAVFTMDFEKEWKNLESAASKWLLAAAAGAVLTLCSAFFFLYLARQPIASVGSPDPTLGAQLSGAQVAQIIGSKLIIVSMLLTAATWCGKNFRALKHLAVVNRHRALSLRTLKAFSSAAGDELTKNAVLLEATRAIFSAGATGYIDGKDAEDSSLKIVEIAKGFGSRPAA
jgi:hypothetical protein